MISEDYRRIHLETRPAGSTESSILARGSKRSNIAGFCLGAFECVPVWPALSDQTAAAVTREMFSRARPVLIVVVNNTRDAKPI